jgi:hypothetical protein
MSRRHRNGELVPIPRVELRAHARAERQRISTELTQLALRTTPDEFDAMDEPAIGFKSLHHHDAERAKAQAERARRGRRHWKQKAWKRRTMMRRVKAMAERAENPLAVPALPGS